MEDFKTISDQHKKYIENNPIRLYDIISKKDAEQILNDFSEFILVNMNMMSLLTGNKIDIKQAEQFYSNQKKLFIEKKY